MFDRKVMALTSLLSYTKVGSFFRKYRLVAVKYNKTVGQESLLDRFSPI